MRSATRMGRVQESATLRISRRVAELKSEGADLVDLAAGEPDFDSPAVAVEAARQALADGLTRYTQVGGDPELRELLAERFRAVGSAWTANDALITVGAKAALLELALALLGEGDEAVIPSPCWVSIPDQVRLAGAEPVFVETEAADGFAVRAEPVLAALTERTRCVILNSPCNPSGGVVPADELRRIVARCGELGVLVISDETYDRFVWDGGEHASVAALAAEFPDTTILVGSFSKTYAMTGWRIGYLFGPPAVVGWARTVQSHATSNATTFAMRGAVAALRFGEAEVVERMRAYEARRDLLVAGLRAIPGLEVLPPAGTFYVFPDVSAFFRPGLDGSIELAAHLLDSAGVVTVPGAAFGADRHLRISFAASEADLREGIGRMRRVLAALAPAPVAGGGRERSP